MLVTASEDSFASSPKVEPGTLYIAAQRRLTDAVHDRFRTTNGCISKTQQSRKASTKHCGSMQLHQNQNGFARWVPVRCSGAKVVLLRV